MTFPHFHRRTLKALLIEGWDFVPTTESPGAITEVLKERGDP